MTLMTGYVKSVLQEGYTPAPTPPALPPASGTAPSDPEDNQGLAQFQPSAGLRPEAVSGGDTAAARSAATAAQAAVCTSLLLQCAPVLFDRIFNLFAQYGQLPAFLETLEGHVTAGRLPYLAPEVMQALVDHFSALGQPQRVERCVLHMNITSLDLNQVGALLSQFPSVPHVNIALQDSNHVLGCILCRNQGLGRRIVNRFCSEIGLQVVGAYIKKCKNTKQLCERLHILSFLAPQVIRLCEQYKMYSALAYIYNQIRDYKKPIMDLLAAVVHSSSQEEARTFGYKLLVYLRCMFAGRQFPPMEAEEAPQSIGSEAGAGGESASEVNEGVRRAAALRNLASGVLDGPGTAWPSALLMLHRCSNRAVGLNATCNSVFLVELDCYTQRALLVFSKGVGAYCLCAHVNLWQRAGSTGREDVRAQALGLLLFLTTQDLAKEWNVPVADVHQYVTDPHPALHILLRIDAAATVQVSLPA